MSTIFVKKCFWHYCLSRYLILKLLEQVWLQGFCQLPSNILFSYIWPPFTNNIWKRNFFVMHVNINACFFYSCLSLSVYNVILFHIHLLHIHSDWNIICCHFTSCTGISIILINIFKHLKAYINFPTLTCLSLSLIICLRLRKCDVI